MAAGGDGASRDWRTLNRLDDLGSDHSPATSPCTSGIVDTEAIVPP
jgi:hypothetical protein